MDWVRNAPFIKKFFSLDKQPKWLPRIMRKYGVKNFQVVDGKIYAFNKEVILDPARIQKILEKEEEGFGGSKKVYYRLRKKHIGISYNAVLDFFNRSERRQLKRETQSTTQQRTFIVAKRPGHFQADLTFYHKAKIVVFGIVDVFSRWCEYTVIKDKTPISTGAALKSAIEKFKKLAPTQTFYKMETDGGSEFIKDPRNKDADEEDIKIDFRTYLETYKETSTKHKLTIIHKNQPQRLIESLNGTLRRYVERVDFKNKAELKEIVARFVEDKNDSVHSVTGSTPNDLLTLATKEEVKAAAKSQLQKGQKRIVTSGRKYKQLAVGSLVRISLKKDKDELGHHGPKALWSKTLYRVSRIVGSTRGADRYKLLKNDGSKVDGLYFRDKLLAVVIPTHSKDQKKKYIPGEAKAGDKKREEEVKRPDKVPELTWASQKTYDDAQDEMEDSGDEYVPVGRNADEDEKAEEVVKRPKRKAKKKPKQKVIGRKVFVLWEEEEWDSPVVILQTYKHHFIVRFTDGSTAGIPDENVERMTEDYVTVKTVERYKRQNKKQIGDIKKDIDSRGDID